jgi:hypothetical protein
VLKVADTYVGNGQRSYWRTLYSEIESGGMAAMLHDLLAMDISGFNVDDIPHTAAKTQQQVLSLRGTEAWLYHVLQEGKIAQPWQNISLVVSTDDAYLDYENFSKQQHAWRPDLKSVWSKKVREVLRSCVGDTRPQGTRSFQFAPMADCRRQFETHLGGPVEWEPEHEPPGVTAVKQTAQDVGYSTELDEMIDIQCRRALEREDK